MYIPLNRLKRKTLSEKPAKIILTIFAAAIVLLSGCRGGNDDTSQPPGRPGAAGPWGQVSRPAISVETAPVSTSNISDEVRSFGTIQARDVVAIIPQVSNRITDIYVDLGDSVRQGDILARIYDVPFRDALEQARAQLRQSRSSLERDSVTYVRQTRLFERGASSQSEYDNARSAYQGSRAQYESARAALTQSRENLRNTELLSPVDGVVLSRSIAVGDLARTGDTVFELANLVGYETRLFLPMQDWEAVRIGMPVALRLSNRDGVIADGIISRISPQLNPVSGLGEVVVTLTDAGPSVRQGALVDARITIITHENTVVIPRSAMIEQIETYINPETNTVEIQRNYVAFVSQGDTLARQRQLELGLQQGERVEVVSGLQKDEQLIITGQRNLSDRSRIRVAGLDRRSAEQELSGDGKPPAGENGPSGERPQTAENEPPGERRSGRGEGQAARARE